MVDIHRYRLRDGFVPSNVICGRKSWDLSKDGEITLVPEFGNRVPPDFTWSDDGFDIRWFLVLDECFCQPYYPFYDWLVGKSEPQNDYQQEIVERYNYILDQVEWLERTQ